MHLLVRVPRPGGASGGPASGIGGVSTAASCVSIQGRVCTVADTVVVRGGPRRPDFGAASTVSVTLDGCFDARAADDAPGSADPAEVYSEVAAPLVADALGGFDAVLIVRGAPGAGKTHAVHGTGDQGIVQRALAGILAADGVLGVDVSLCAVLEAQGGEGRRRGGVVDLLAPEALCGAAGEGRTGELFVRRRPAVQALASGAGFVDGLTGVAVGDAEGTERVLALATHARHLLASRGGAGAWHEVVHVTVRRADPSAPQGSLRFVEVAHAGRAALDRCLAALSVHALRGDDAALALPVRESPLTWLLADALAGRARLGFLVCASPDTSARADTLAELRFAAQCRGIADRAVRAEPPEAQVASLRAEVDELKTALAHAGGDRVRSARLRADLHACQSLLVPLEQPFEARVGSGAAAAAVDAQHAAAKAFTGLVVRSRRADVQMRTQARLVLLGPSAGTSGLLCYVVPGGTSRVVDALRAATEDADNLCLRLPGPLVAATLACNPATGSVTLAIDDGTACSVNGSAVAADRPPRLLQNGDRLALGASPNVLVFVAPGAENPGLHAPALEAMWHAAVAAHAEGSLEGDARARLEAGLEAALCAAPGASVDIPTRAAHDHDVEGDDADAGAGAAASLAASASWRARDAGPDAHEVRELGACGLALLVACREARQFAEACGREVEFTVRVGRLAVDAAGAPPPSVPLLPPADAVAGAGPSSRLGARARDVGFVVCVVARDVASGACHYFGADAFAEQLDAMRSAYAAAMLSSLQDVGPSGFDAFTGLALDVLSCRAPAAVAKDAERARLRGEIERLTGEAQKAKSVSNVGADALRALRAKVAESEGARAKAEARVLQSEAELKLAEEAKHVAIEQAAKADEGLRAATEARGEAERRALALERKLQDVAGSESERLNTAEMRALEERHRADALAAQLQKFGGRAESAEERVGVLEAELTDVKASADADGRDHERRLKVAEAAHKSELRSLRDELESERLSAQAVHEGALKALRDELEDVLRAERAEHEGALKALRDELEDALRAEQTEHEGALKALRDELEDALRAEQTEHEGALKALRDELQDARRASHAAEESLELSRQEFVGESEAMRVERRESEALAARAEDSAVERTVALEARVLELSEALAAEIAHQREREDGDEILAGAARAKAAELEALNASLREEVARANAAAQGQMGADAAERAALEKQVGDLGKLVRRTTEQLEESARALAEREAELLAHRRDADAALAAREEQVKVHEEEAASLRVELADAHAAVDHRVAEALEHAAAERASQGEAHAREAAALRAELEAQEVASRAALAALEARAKTHEENALSLRADLDDQSKHLRASTAQLVAHEDEVMALRAQLESSLRWKVAYEEAQATLGPAAAGAAESAALARRLGAELEAAQRERQAATALLEEATVALRETRGHLQERDAEVARSRPALEAAEQAAEALRRHRDATRADLVETRARCEALEGEAHRLRSASGDAGMALAKAESDLEQKRQQIEFLQGVLEQVGGAQDEEKAHLQEELERAKSEVIRLRQHNAEVLSAEAARVTAVADELAKAQRSNASRQGHSVAALEADLHSERLKRAVAEELLADAEERLYLLLGEGWRHESQAGATKVAPAFGPGAARRSLGALPAAAKRAGAAKKPPVARKLVPGGSRGDGHAHADDPDAIQYGGAFYERRRPLAKRRVAAKRPPPESQPRDRYEPTRPVTAPARKVTTPRAGTAAAAAAAAASGAAAVTPRGAARAALDVIYSSMLAQGVKSRARDTFIAWDTDRDGTLSRAEFAGALEALGMRLTDVHLDAAFSFLDVNCNGRVSYVEFDRALRRHAAAIAATAPALARA